MDGHLVSGLVVVVALLRLDSVTRSFRRGSTEIPVLQGVSLEVRTGDLVALYGDRGSGKTTLLKTAAGFEAPDVGAVLFEGKDLSRASRRQLTAIWHRGIAWVRRDGPHSLELPVRTYVALALYRHASPREADRKATKALTRVGADDCGDQQWGDLPDTSRMLVAIAHALVREPRLLIVDDPTAGLGIIDRERIVGLLRSAAEDDGLGILMAVPDMPSMLNAHQMRLLSRGRLVAPPSPSSTQRTNGSDPGGRRSA